MEEELINSIIATNEDINKTRKNTAEGNTELEVNKKKRRRKNVVEGRNFVCHCGKAYLSQPALNIHIKIKHTQNSTSDKEPKNIERRRSKAKQKKDHSKINEFIYQNFFKTTERKIKSKDDLLTDDYLKALLDEIFNEIFIKAKFKFYSNYNSIHENNLMKNLLNKINFKQKDDIKTISVNDPTSIGIKTENQSPKVHVSINKSVDEKFKNSIKKVDSKINYSNLNKKKIRKIKKTTDLILSEYIELCYKNCNKKSLKSVLLFVFLMREMINKIKNEDFCLKNRPLQIPSLMNEFFPFLNEINILETFSDDVKISFVENIIHFSHWLLDNSHTKMRVSLSLLDNNSKICVGNNET